MTGTAWQPDPAWMAVPSGRGGAGVWRVPAGDRVLVVKRLTVPQPDDDPAVLRPSTAAYWRREAEAALDGSLATTRGLRAAPVVAVDEDPEGVTITTESVAEAGSNGLFLARALGVFAGSPLEPQPWWARDLLAERLARADARGGWRTLARTTLADVAEALWTRRGRHLARLASYAQVPSHGDPTPANLPGRAGDDVLALDWASFGSAPVGADLGYLALSVREDLGVLLEAYVDGLVAGGTRADPAEVRDAASVMACYTALTRAEWALARAAAGGGALAGKYRHPSVAPYLRSLQRLFPELETLLAA